MKDIKTNGGEIYTDADYLSQRSGGTAKLVPEFIPTQDDLQTLAFALAKEILDDEYFMSLQSASSWIRAYDYKVARFDRLWSFLSAEVQAELDEVIRIGRIKVKQDVEQFEVYMGEIRESTD